MIKTVISNLIRKIKELRYRSKLKKKAIKKGAALKMKENGYVYHCTKADVSFYLPEYKRDYIQQKIITSGNYYEEKALKYVTKTVLGGAISKTIKDRCVLDIGSNIGNHTLYLLKECNAGVVHCFEPMDNTFSILKKNISLNGYDQRVVFHHVAVGARSSQAVLKHCEKNNMGTAEMAYHEDGDIKIITIDDICIDGSVSFVKIDVEGFELEVIKGMVNTLKKHLPYLMVEIRKEFIKEILSILEPLGYWYINVGKGMNYLFIPQSIDVHGSA